MLYSVNRNLEESSLCRLKEKLGLRVPSKAQSRSSGYVSPVSGTACVLSPPPSLLPQLLPSSTRVMKISNRPEGAEEAVCPVPRPVIWSWRSKLPPAAAAPASRASPAPEQLVQSSLLV